MYDRIVEKNQFFFSFSLIKSLDSICGDTINTLIKLENNFM